MKKAHIFVGLGFGDEGKGTMVDYACRLHQSDLVVRFNGGAQAAHNVVNSDGQHHVFAQFGAGAFVPGVRTLLSKYMLWNPISLVHEVEVLSPKLKEHALNRHLIDARAPVITPYHVVTNRAREQARGKGKHGSCGMGVGELAYDLVYHPDQVIRAGDLTNKAKVEALLRLIQKRKLAELEASNIGPKEVDGSAFSGFFQLVNEGESSSIARALATLAKEMQIIPPEAAMRVLREARNPVLEGAQGVLLDEWHGFHPFTTWSTTTPKNARELLAECGFRGQVEVTGILRSYTTRHGAGPFVTECPEYTYISPGEHNQLNEWQGTFRSGPLDGVLLRYAVKCVNYVGGLDNLAITHMDILRDRGTLLVCDSYAGDAEIRELEAQNRQDLAHQEQLTLLLQRVKPKHQIEIRARSDANDDGAKDLIAYVSKQTNLPVSYLSYGPKAGHKQRV